MRLRKIFNFMILILLTILLSSSALSFTLEEKNNSNEINFFYSKTCPHCLAELKFLKSIENECTVLKINYYIASKNEELLNQFAEVYNTGTSGVPRTYVADKAFIGFSPENGPLEKQLYRAYIGYENQLRDTIFHQQHKIAGNEINQTCQHNNIEDIPKMSPIHYIVFAVVLIYGLSFFFFKKRFTTHAKVKKYWISLFVLILIIAIFIFIKSFSEVAIKNFALSLPFPFFVFILALADGFNPCAFTVLIILLSLLTYTKRKSDMLFIGITFIITSAIMYFIFIMVMILFGSWAMDKYSEIIMIGLGTVIIIAGIINVKDFFFFNKGISLTLGTEHKKKITTKARNILNLLKDGKDAKTFIMALGGTILLAIFVNMVELGCTAILPTIYMASILKTYGNNIGIQHVLWTLFYSVVYILPLFAILGNFIYSFKSTRLTETQGKKLKLFSGIMMIVFGLVMIFSPNILIFN